MTKPETPQNPEISLKEQAQAIIEAWRNKGLTHVYYDPTTASVAETGHSSWKTEIDSPKVLKWIIDSLQRNHKYKIN